MTDVLLSQLAQVEITSNKPQESVDWFVNVLGLELTTTEGHSAYLRGWGDYLHHTLVVTEGDQPTLGHIGWRTYGPSDVDTIAQRVDPDLAEGLGWIDSAVGHGRAFRFHRGNLGCGGALPDRQPPARPRRLRRQDARHVGGRRGSRGWRHRRDGPYRPVRGNARERGCRGLPPGGSRTGRRLPAGHRRPAGVAPEAGPIRRPRLSRSRRGRAGGVPA